MSDPQLMSERELAVEIRKCESRIIVLSRYLNTYLDEVEKARKSLNERMVNAYLDRVERMRKAVTETEALRVGDVQRTGEQNTR